VTATDLLRASLTPAGFLASPTERTNYRRVWARDGVVCGLAGLASGEDDLADGLRATLETLAANLGPRGQVPSNVSVDGEAVSYGGLAGRVDAGPWFVLGAALYARQRDRAFADRMAAPVGRVLRLLDAWEFNGRGLVYVPQSGDWADEYDLHGYLLFDQVLRIAALRAWAHVAPDGPAVAARAERLAALVEATFWPSPGADADASYHPAAFRQSLAEGPVSFPFAALTPGGYVRRFDALGSAVALLGGLWTDRAGALLDHGLALAADTAPGLVPAFAPTVGPGDPGWEALRGSVRDTFSNRPGHYHNGGCWPFVNGWWAAALAHHGRRADAARLAERVDAANARGDGFPEYLDADAGGPHGTQPLAWSAAGSVLARAALDGRLGGWWTPVASGASARAVPGVGGAGGDAEPVEAVVAGEALVDLLSTEAAADLGGASAFERHAGGSAFNLASNLGRLGVPTTFVASVGADGFGRLLAGAAARAGVRPRLREHPDEPTSLATVTRTVGTPDFALYRHADRHLAPDQLPDALLRGARLFHTSGFALSREPARTALLDAAARADGLGLALSVDLNVAPRSAAERREQQAAVWTLLALGPLVKASRDDAARLFGADLDDREAAGRLTEAGARLVCLTRGAEGALVVWEGGHAEVPAAPARVADATGAGDAFWAGFLAAWLDGQAPRDCARAGGRLAALKLTTAGPLPDRVDAEAVLGLRQRA
jgi:sugar/nucleoside kinase (ribokinase family)